MEQLLADIASYYGYNDFLAEKLFNLFSVLEVDEFLRDVSTYAHDFYRPSNSLNLTRCLGQ